MGRLRSFAPVLISLIIALVGSFFLYQWMRNNKKPSKKSAPAQESNEMAIVVAKEDIAWGTKIAPQFLTTALFLRKSLPLGCFASPGEVENRVVISSLKKGDPIVEHRLAPVDIKRGGVSVVLNSGKRAIAVKGDQVIGISGFIKPGNRVDVLVTIKEPVKKIDITKTVLEDIPVLASGIEIEDNGKGEPSPVSVYTLEVTPEQGERLILAATKGHLQFALRNISDPKSVPTKGVTVPELLESITIAAETGPKKKATLKQTRKRRAKIVIIRGLEATEIPVQL